MKRLVRRFAGVAAAGVVAALAWKMQPQGSAGSPSGPQDVAAQHPVAASRGEVDAAREAFEQQAQGRQLLVQGTVLRTLSDDRDGSPHQRFIIATDSGQTLLVAHNLDLAPRLRGLAAGERVTVYGEYEWNAQGGVMHWTHDDPRGTHVAGYIDWRGRRYQ